MDSKFKSTSLLRGPKLTFEVTPRISVPTSKLFSKANPDFQFGRILCNVEDVFQKKNQRPAMKEPLDHTKFSNICVKCKKPTSKKHAVVSKKPINNNLLSLNNIHEVTLGPNVILQNGVSKNTFENSKSLDVNLDNGVKSVMEKSEAPPNVNKHSNLKNVTADPSGVENKTNKDTRVCENIYLEETIGTCSQNANDLSKYFYSDNSFGATNSNTQATNDIDLDETIRIYIKKECLNKSQLDIPKHISERITEFNSRQKQEFLNSKKAIEQSVISDQLRFQNELSRESCVSHNGLNIVEKNKTARQGILNALNEVKTKIFKQKQKELEEHALIEREKQEQLAALGKLVATSYSKFKSLEDIFLNNLKCCKDVARFQREGQELINFNSKLSQDLNTLANKCKQGSITRTEVEQLGNLMGKCEECFSSLGKIHETIQTDAHKVFAKPSTQEIKNDVILVDERTPIPNEELSDSVGQMIDPSSLVFYKSCSEFYQFVEAQLESLIQDASMKSYRFQCMKAFNMPINAIDGLDGRHTLDQCNRLLSVLRGNKELNCGGRVSQHPLGVLFCKYSMAKKFVAQIDVKPRVLFAYASVIIELWREFPDFGKLLLGAFHRQCPYLVPVFWPQLEGQMNEDYYKSLGYLYVDGQVEKQDMFLKRMTAMVQMYAAITISPTRNTGSQPHPHNLQYSWRWLAAMLNLEPQPDVSAMLIYSYLKIAGNKMALTYKKQFFKLIQYIQSHYLKKIKQVTPEDQSQQSIAILEGLINKIIKSQHIPPPEGQLPARFW